MIEKFKSLDTDLKILLSISITVIIPLIIMLFMFLHDSIKTYSNTGYFNIDKSRVQIEVKK